MLVELPHSGVLVRPEHRDAVDAAGQHLGRLGVQHVALRDVQRRGLDQVAPGAELELGRGCVPVANRAGALVAAEMIERLPARRHGAVEVVERSEVRSGLAHGAQEAAKRLLHLLGDPEPHQCVEGERGVAHP